MWRKHRQQIPEAERVVKDVERSRERTMNRAVRLLAAKPRSIGELKQRLLEKPWTNAEIVDAVIAKLTEYRYVNDNDFARGFADAKLRDRPQGRRRLEYSLAQKKLDSDTISRALDDAFEARTEQDLVREATERWTRVRGVPADERSRKKLFDHLMRRGFSYDDIRSAVSELGPPPSEEQV